MNAIKQKVVTTRNFVRKHRVAIAVTTTSVFWIWVNRKGMKQHNDFLKKHNLYEAFYAEPDEEI